MTERKTKTFTYWRVRFSPEPHGRTMQELLNLTFDNTKIRDRILKIAEDSESFECINYKTDRRNFFCSNLIGYEKGKMGQLIKESLDEDRIEPEAFKPTAKDGTDGHLLDGKLFFVCFKDHLIVCQDQTIRGKQLERYLFEMIRNRNESMRKSLSFTLERSMSENTKKKVAGVKRLTISSPIEYSTDTHPEPRNPGTDIQVKRAFLKGHAWEAVKAFVKDKVDLTEFNTEGVIDPKDIEVTVSLAWKNKKRSDTVSDSLDAITNAFRHVEDELDLEIETTSGTLKKDDLRLQIAKSVPHKDDMPIADEIFDKMISWYDELNSAGEI